ncbi:MAG TPA: hypothetical protein VKZ53_05740 [Candidatus Angelobacter sp.]|nr:hypothetical protein [Candidatus Angelobacter sp.]
MGSTIQASFLRLLCRFALCGLLQAATFGLAGASSSPDDTEPSTKPSPSVIADWLAQGERKQLSWRVFFSEPTLQYDQTNVVFVKVDLPFENLKKKGKKHDLHFIVSATDETGRWSNGNAYRHQPLDINASKDLAMTFTASASFRPGRFRIAAIVYDTVDGKRSVTFHRVVVPPQRPESSPELFRLFPRVTFDTPWTSYNPSFLVTTQRSIQMDMVIEFDPHFIYKKRLYRLKHANLPFMSAAAALTRLNFENGCVRVSGLNSLELGTLVPPQPAKTVDWEFITTRLGEKNLQERTRVSVAELTKRPSTDGAPFFERHLEQLLADPPCPVASAPPLRVLAIITEGTDFVERTSYSKIESQCQCVVFYIRARFSSKPLHANILDSLELGADQDIDLIETLPPRRRGIQSERQLEDAAPGDDLRGIAKHLSPKVYDLGFEGPVEFQQAFFYLVETLKNLSSETVPPLN